MSLMKRLRAVAVLAAVLVIGLVGVAAAQAGQGDEKPAESAAATATLAEGVEYVDEFGEFDEDDFFEDWELSDEEIAEFNAETDALVEHLKGLGFEVAVETDELGLRYLDFTVEDEGLWEAVDAFYMAQFAEEVAGWSDEEKAEWNAGVDEFVADLAAEGITVETEEIAPGVRDIVWTDELEEALYDYDMADIES